MVGFPNIQLRQDVFDSTARLKQCVQQPSDFITDLLIQQQQFTCIRWIHRFEILAKLPLPPGAIAYADLAKQVQLPESTLRSVTRMAMTANFLCETTEGKLAHNSLSVAFVEDDNLFTWLSYSFGCSVPCMTKFIEATERWPDPTKGNETAYNIVMNTELSFFNHLKADPERSAEFGKYMVSQSKVHAGASVDHLLVGLDWKALGKATVVDVGGSSGSASLALAKAFQDLKFVVQDLPEPIKSAQAQAKSLPSEIAGRIEFMEHDFFTPQPVKHAGVYLLRMIIHDWPDADAIRILRELVVAMDESSRIIIMDMVLPTPGTASPTLEAALRQKDLTMRQVLGGKEREVEDWHVLVRKVDVRLRVVAIRRPEGSQHSVIEISRSAAPQVIG